LRKVLRRLLSIVKGGVCGLVALALAAPACFSQQFTFNTVTQGLGNLNVNCIAQDRQGYLWVGTENGLYRYDGRLFRQFGVPEGLHGHIIQSLFPRRTELCSWAQRRAFTSSGQTVNSARFIPPRR
jgi:ligand-binding sensor domain-containing protein